MTVAAAKAYLATNYGQYGTIDIQAKPDETFTAGMSGSHTMTPAQYYEYMDNTPSLDVDGTTFSYCFDDFMASTGGLCVKYGVFITSTP